MADNRLHLYQGFSLIDITPTGQISWSADCDLERNQQRNWETVQQIISLRTQPQILSTSDNISDLKNYQFGINYVGQHKVWNFLFGVEYRDVYQQEADAFGLLRNDFKLIPVVTNLTETAESEQSIFYSSGPWTNIYFKTIANDK